MVNATTTGHAAAVAYQGGEPVNTPRQEPKSGNTQPKQAPAADTQREERRSQAQDHADRGRKVDVKA